jgi:hypothetical protein
VELRRYLGGVRAAEQDLADALTMLADRHSADADTRDTARLLARWSRRHVAALAPAIERYGMRELADPARLRAGLFDGPRIGGVGLLRDLNDLLALVGYVRGAWTAVFQAAMELHDRELSALCTAAAQDTDRQLAWVKTRLRLTAPQALTVPPAYLAELLASAPKTGRPAAWPELAWVPLASAALVGMVGMLGLVAGQAWLVASLGPTAYLLAQMPAHPSTRVYNVVVGHLLGLAGGIVAVWITGAASAPVVLETGQLTGARIGAAVLAVALTAAAALALKASHPPAGATTLLVALGFLRTPMDAANVAIGAALIAVLGLALRRLRLGRWPRQGVTHARSTAGIPSVTEATANDLKRAA